jgi:hypothetical protein
MNTDGHRLVTGCAVFRSKRRAIPFAPERKLQPAARKESPQTNVAQRVFDNLCRLEPALLGSGVAPPLMCG